MQANASIRQPPFERMATLVFYLRCPLRTGEIPVGMVREIYIRCLIRFRAVLDANPVCIFDPIRHVIAAIAWKTIQAVRLSCRECDFYIVWSFFCFFNRPICK